MGEHAALIICLTHRRRSLVAHKMVNVSALSSNYIILILEHCTRRVGGKSAHDLTAIDTCYDKDSGAEGEWLLFGTWGDLNAVDHVESMS
jgi:hypothetical protein